MKHPAPALPLLLLLALTAAPSLNAQAAPCGRIPLGQNGPLDGFVPFFPTDAWNRDITNAPIDSNSAALIATIGTATKLHPDFGSGDDYGSYIGIPYQVVGKVTPLVDVAYNQYPQESDPGLMPIPRNALIEGYPAPSTPGGGDNHLLVIDRSTCFLYELFGAYIDTSGNVSGGSGAIWDLRRDTERPYTWTSTDAAGLPVFPGLARYDEVAAGAIDHALRFTLSATRAAFVPPARHWAANSSNPNAAPMGMRMRLHASFDISHYPPQSQVILTALKKYGMILADNGSSIFISGAPNPGWDNDDLHALTGVTAANFDVLDNAPLYTAANLPTGHVPRITSFTALPSPATGKTTLRWTAPNASTTFFVTPTVGPVRGYSTEVAPSSTTTYTLYATNDFGRTTATVTVTVP